MFIPNTETIAVDAGAAMTVGATTVTLDDYNGGTYGITVAGTLTATNSDFAPTRLAYGTGSGITVLSSGHLIATGTTFSWDAFRLNDGSVLNPGDLANDTFQTITYAPGTDIPLLAGSNLAANKSFQDVDVNAGSLGSGTLTLGLMGSASTSKLRYVFPSGYEVKSGATLAIANGVNVFIPNTETIAVDAGAAMTVGATTVTLDDYNGGTYGITVAGTLTATNSDFAPTRLAYGTGSGITVLSSGHLIATGTTFSWDAFRLNDGSVLNPGDLANDTFQTITYAPGTDIPLLAGSNLAANESFQDVDINAGSLGSGTLTLGLMGSASTSKLRYVFPSGYEVKSGATLAIANGVNVFIPNTETIAVNAGAAMTVGATTVTLDDYNGGTYGITVAGTLTATNSDFAPTRLAYGTGSGITVLSSGHLIATGTTFSWDAFRLNDGSVLNPGDLANDTFQTITYAPGTDIPLLAGSNLAANESFQDVDVNAGSLNSGQSLVMGLMGSASTAKLRYVFPSGYEVKSGASLVIENSVNVFIPNLETIAVDAGAAMTDGAATVTLDNYNGGAYGITVAGSLNTSGTLFTPTRPAYGTGSGITVLTGGQLTASNTTFAWDSLSLNAGSTGGLAVDVFNTQLTINSGTTAGVTLGNFTNGTVVASGDPKATITLVNNYWGTTNTTQIAAKITDNKDNSNLPTVNYTPFLSAASSPGVASATAASNTSATFNSSSQTITLSATVTSGTTKINEGNETFTILSGINIIGTPVTVAVANGVATTSTYTLPAGTGTGTYTIQAIYYGTGNYLGYIDSSHTLTINAAATTTAAKSASTTYSTAPQSVPLSATITSGGGSVNGGTVTFTILNGGTTIASATSGSIVNGAATATVTLPAGTAIGNYAIQAAYSGSANFGGSSDNSHALTVSSTATTTTLASSANPSVVGQIVTFAASVVASSPGLGTPTGTVTFLDGTTTLGTGTLSNGTATFTTSGLPLNANSITAAYGGSSTFAKSTSIGPQPDRQPGRDRRDRPLLGQSLGLRTGRRLHRRRDPRLAGDGRTNRLGDVQGWLDHPGHRGAQRRVGDLSRHDPLQRLPLDHRRLRRRLQLQGQHLERLHPDRRPEPRDRIVHQGRRDDAGELDRRLRLAGLRHRQRPHQPALLRHRHPGRPVHLHLVHHLHRPPRPAGPQLQQPRRRRLVSPPPASPSPSTSTTARATTWSSTSTTGTARAAPRRCSSATPPRGPSWTPSRSRRSPRAPISTGRSRATW